MSREIVKDDDVAGLEKWSELGLNVGVESRPVDRSIDNPGSDKPFALQASNQGLGSPAAKGCFAVQAFALQTTPTTAGKFRIGAGLVNEHQSLTMFTHDRLAARLPLRSCLNQVWPVLF